ncbi:MAG: cupredoxin family copper-binding protein [Solirubrobacteraceae bacterium]|nr:cupredoxin family copper-binding protein [Patulibacter sp.]
MPHAARSRLTTIALLVLALALAGVMVAALSPGGTGQPATASAASTIKVDIKDFKYSKTPLTVKVGQKVTWTNRDSMEHDVDPTKSAKGAPHSKLLKKGQSYTWTATKKGTFNYICSVHPYMKGKVIVK